MYQHQFVEALTRLFACDNSPLAHGKMVRHPHMRNDAACILHARDSLIA